MQPKSKLARTSIVRWGPHRPQDRTYVAMLGTAAMPGITTVLVRGFSAVVQSRHEVRGFGRRRLYQRRSSTERYGVLLTYTAVTSQLRKSSRTASQFFSCVFPKVFAGPSRTAFSQPIRSLSAHFRPAPQELLHWVIVGDISERHSCLTVLNDPFSARQGSPMGVAGDPLRRLGSDALHT